MTDTPEIPVRGQIRLGQFLKLAALAEDGAQARGLVQGGDVRVNGAMEVRRGRRLSPGDLVEVDAGLAQPADGGHSQGRPEHRVHQAQRVDAQVQQGAAGEVGTREALNMQQRLEVVGAHVLDGAQRAADRERAHQGLAGQEAHPHGLHGEQAPVPRGAEDAAGLDGAAGEGLLHQDGLARLQGQERVVGVEGVRRGDVDGVDVGVGDEVLVGAVGANGLALARTRMGLDEGPGPGGVTASDGGDETGGVGGHVTGEGAGDVAGAQDPPAQHRGVLRLGDRPGEVERVPGLGQGGHDLAGQDRKQLGGTGAGCGGVGACHAPSVCRRSGGRETLRQGRRQTAREHRRPLRR